MGNWAGREFLLSIRKICLTVRFVSCAIVSQWILWKTHHLRFLQSDWTKHSSRKCPMGNHPAFAGKWPQWLYTVLPSLLWFCFSSAVLTHVHLKKKSFQWGIDIVFTRISPSRSQQVYGLLRLDISPSLADRSQGQDLTHLPWWSKAQGVDWKLPVDLDQKDWWVP